MLVACLVMLVNDPHRGINDDMDTDAKGVHTGSLRQDIFCILSNPAYLVATFGMCANSFAVGAFADWYDALLLRYTGTSLVLAGLVLAGATVIGGICGSVLGAKAAQFYEPRWKNAYFLVPALFTVPGTLFACGAINILSNASVAIFCMIVGEVFFFTYGPPMQTTSLAVMPVHLRARSSGIQIFLIHVLGDVISPPIVGLVSDRSGSLLLALQLAWVALAASGLIWFAGYHFLPPLPSSSAGVDAAEGAAPTTLWSVLFQVEDEERKQEVEMMAVRDDGIDNALYSPLGRAAC